MGVYFLMREKKSTFVYLKCVLTWSWEDGPVSKLLALQAQGSEFDSSSIPRSHIKRAGLGGQSL